MANERQTARGKVKSKLDIASAVTTFDSLLDDCLEQAIPRLAPWIQYQLAADESVSLAANTDNFTLPVSGSALQRLFARTSSSEYWAKLDLWRQNRDTIYLTDLSSSARSLKILATRPYKYTDADFAQLATDYPSAMLPLYLFTMSEFATYLAGNKRKFNIYQQSNGARTLDEMKDLATFYEDRAVRILEDEISSEGQ